MRRTLLVGQTLRSGVCLPFRAGFGTQSIGEHIRMGPSVKLMLLQHNLQPSKITASGPKGSLLKGDVLDFLDKHGMVIDLVGHDSGFVDSFE